MAWELVPNKNCPGSCPYPNLCFEPASFSAPGNALSLCLPPGLTPKGLAEQFYSIPTGAIVFWIFGILALGFVLGVLVGLLAYHLRRHRHHSVSFVREGFGRETMRRFRQCEKREKKLIIMILFC